MRFSENLNLPILQDGDKYSKEIQNEAFNTIDRECTSIKNTIKSALDISEDVSNAIKTLGDISEELSDLKEKQNEDYYELLESNNYICEKIKDINSQLDTMTNTKIDYPILQCEIDKVVNVKYEYGNILRYGAVSNYDSTNAFQVAFDICRDSGHSVKIPNVGQYLLLSPIILYPNVKYKMIQDNNIGFTSQSKADYRIMCKCDMFKTTDDNKEISIDIDGVTVIFNKDGIDNGYINDLSVFHKVRVYQSIINNFTVECAGYFFKEAGCNVNTVIQNSYIHSLSIAFSGEVNTNYLMSDSIIKNCRISGRANQNPVFLDGQVDTDMKFEGNFIDYFAYFMGGTSTTTAYHCGVSIGNTFNRMFRMFKNSGKGTFINNTYEYFNKDSAFTNKTPLMENGKWGAFVFDKENEYRGYQDLTLIDNIVHECDYFLYYVPNNTSNNAYGTNIIERGTIGTATYETFIFNPRTSTSKTGYLSSKILSLDYEDRSNESVPTSLSKQETYNGSKYNVYDTWCGCHRFYNDGLYIACPDLTWKKIT